MTTENVPNSPLRCAVPAVELASLTGHLVPRVTAEFYASHLVSGRAGTDSARTFPSEERARDEPWVYWSDVEDEEDEEDWAEVGELFSEDYWNDDHWDGAAPRTSQGPKVVCPSCGGSYWIEWAPADYVQFEVHLRLSEDIDPILETEATDSDRLMSATDVGEAEFFACSRCDACHEYQ